MLTLAERPGIWFPVMLYNGQQLIIAGHVKLSQSDNYISFNSTIGRLLNIHPQCIKSFLMDPGATSPMQYRWKATISPWTDFSLVCQQKDCCFLVTVSPPHFAGRHRQEPMVASAYVHSVQEWVAEAQRQKLMEMLQNHKNKNADADANANANANVNVSQSQIQQEPSPPKVITRSGVCEECNAAADNDAFHHCTLDAIVVGGYRTSFGPIGPWQIEPVVNAEPENDPNHLYSLFGPMPRVDVFLNALRQSLSLGQRLS